MHATTSSSKSLHPGLTTGLPIVGLPLTPSVALRALYEQLRSYWYRVDQGLTVEFDAHFCGPIVPPSRYHPRPIGDVVIDAIAEYASKVVSQAGLFAGAVRVGRSRELFTVEHALAIDLGRTTPLVTLGRRELAAGAVLGLAAYWCDADHLIEMDHPRAHPLLGLPPLSPIPAVLYHHARVALAFAQADVSQQ